MPTRVGGHNDLASTQELKDHAGDAKEFLLGVCESSPALLKETCVKVCSSRPPQHIPCTHTNKPLASSSQVANSTGDAIQKALEKAYDTLTEDKLCATLCKETDAIAAAQEATAAAAQHFAEQLQSLVDQARATLQGMVQGPFDVACSTCKNMVTKTKDWIKVHQVRPPWGGLYMGCMIVCIVVHIQEWVLCVHTCHTHHHHHC